MEKSLDQGAVTLAKAIARTETGGHKDPYNAKGKSGEYGAYQFTQPTWRNYAKQVLGDENAQPTMENQNKVAYGKIKQWKDSGYNPAQIASMWNAGEGRPNAFSENHKGVNSYGVAYDVPDYVNKVSNNYRMISGEQPQSRTNITEKSGQSDSVIYEKQKLQEQGQPQSVKENRAEPTLGGKLIRGLIKPFVRAGNTLVQGAQLLGGRDLGDFNQNSKYLGDISGYGMKQGQTAGQRVKDIAGGLLELGSFAIGGGQAKAGLTALKEGGLLGKGLVKSAAQGAKTGLQAGALGGAGIELQNPESNLGSIATQGAVGGALGAISGGLLGGIGGATTSAWDRLTPVLGEKQVNYWRGKMSEDLSDAFQTKTGINLKSDPQFVQTIESMIDMGIVPSEKAGRFDTTKAVTHTDDLLSKMKKAKQEWLAQDTSPTSIENYRNLAIKDAEMRFSDSPDHLQNVIDEIDKAFNRFKQPNRYGDTVNRSQAYKLQNENDISNIARWDSMKTPTEKMDAARTIYGAVKNATESADQTGTLSKMNSEMSQLIRIKKILKGTGKTGRGGLHGAKIPSKELPFLLKLLSGETGRSIGSGIGASIGGVPGALVGGQIENTGAGLINRLLGGELGFGSAGFEKAASQLRKESTKKTQGLIKSLK